MNNSDIVFLKLVKTALSDNTFMSDPELTLKEWEYILKRASEQDILPLILDVCIYFTSIKALEKEKKVLWRQKAVNAAIRQIIQTNEFLTLILHAQSQGLDSLVIKGIICRNLYPKPMLRPSVDEDLFILTEDIERWNQFLLSEGLFADEGDFTLDERIAAEELSYHKDSSPTYIEIHKSLLPTSSMAYGSLNTLFERVFEHTVTVQIEDVTLRTLAPTDHFLYLLCHAYKHFLHAGVGIRQVADMALFANAYGEDIDWEYVYTSCQKVHIEMFAAALLQIANKYLTLNTIPVPFSEVQVDEEPLLEDILSGGLYGTADIDRAHSGNITLDAVAARRQGRRRRGVWHSLFPGKNYLQNHFPYAKKYPVLLPAAWAQRIVSYLRRDGKDRGNPGQSIQIGRERIELLKKYGII